MDGSHWKVPELTWSSRCCCIQSPSRLSVWWNQWNAISPEELREETSSVSSSINSLVVQGFVFMDSPVQIVQLFNTKWLFYFLVSRMTDVISEKFKLHMILGETYHSLETQNMSIIFKNMNDNMIGINSPSDLWPVNNGQNSFEQ